MFATVAGCAHMAQFIAGATSTGAVVASSAAPARSSAIPAAMRASRSAEAGATTTMSCPRARAIWPRPSASSSSDQRSCARGRLVMACSACGVTKRAPPSVSSPVTEAPALPSRRASSSALKAATEPETISRTRLPFSMAAGVAAMLNGKRAVS
ncbi:hypothetical protein ROTAS13_04805 [Roseomonas sp. TAS13]|nr:hypothetical protein ROTAS13_04805 [Roseomonas sp. TAS13]